jgi:hypothetical protein
MDQAYAGFARATKRADAGVGYCLATAVHIADSGASSAANQHPDAARYVRRRRVI